MVLALEGTLGDPQGTDKGQPVSCPALGKSSCLPLALEGWSLLTVSFTEQKTEAQRGKAPGPRSSGVSGGVWSERRAPSASPFSESSPHLTLSQFLAALPSSHTRRVPARSLPTGQESSSLVFRQAPAGFRQRSRMGFVPSPPSPHSLPPVPPFPSSLVHPRSSPHLVCLI